MTQIARELVYDTLHFTDWESLLAHFQAHRNAWQGWVFRGHRDSRWSLKTSLERAALDRFQCSPADMPEVEEGLIRRFERQIHHYVAVSPPADFMQWLALMQHYGAPTRLLDFTYSFFVAAYFALEGVSPDETCAIWALDRDWWGERALLQLPEHVAATVHGQDPNVKLSRTVQDIVKRDEPVPLIFPLNPYRLDQRLVLQQGVFMAPGDIRHSFMQNISAIANAEAPDHLVKLDLTCDIATIRRGVRDLHGMNINRATLFPGLDGFAQHLSTLIAMRETIATDTPGSSWGSIE